MKVKSKDLTPPAHDPTSPPAGQHPALHNKYSNTPVKTWDRLQNIFDEEFSKNKENEEWIFRGHNEEDWPLRTEFERALCDIAGKDCKKDEDVKSLLSDGFDGNSVRDIERGLIRKFKRQHHHFDLRMPNPNNYSEWLSIMRHYGAPVRLLDWTYSFLIAVFFAIEKHSKAGAAVWALEKSSVKDETEKNKVVGKILQKDPDVRELETWKSCFLCPKEPQLFVYPTNPFRLNERLVIQQGDLLCPGDISKTFEENLAAVLPEIKEGYGVKLRK